MGNRAQVADFVSSTVYELCELCRDAALTDLARLLEMAALEATNIAAPEVAIEDAAA